MTHKVESDAFAGHQIELGHGIRFAAIDKHFVAFESRKTFRMWRRKRNPTKIAWTQHFRRDHKKFGIDTTSKEQRIIRKKVVRGYAGTSAKGSEAVQAVKTRVAAAKKDKK